MINLKRRSLQMLTLLADLRLGKVQVAGSLSLYYALTAINALLEGIGTLLLVNVFTGGMVGTAANALPNFVSYGLAAIGGDAQIPGVLPLLIGLFTVNFILRMGLLVFDGAITAVLRQRVQEAVFTRYMRGDWAYMRDSRVGDVVGTNTQEALIVSKYLISAVSAVQYFVGALVIALLALTTSVSMSIALGLIALPLAVLMQQTFRIQARLSKQSAALRNDFSADITDRFNGLLQVHVDHNYAYHLRQGLRTQSELTRLDIWVGICQAVIGAFGLLLPLVALIACAIWLRISGAQNLDLSLIASIGVLGVRVAAQLNAAVASVGNLSRLSGSLYPVLAALGVPPVRDRTPVPEPVVAVELDRVRYAYGDRTVLDQVTVTIARGEPLVLSGRSGQGKTTLANMVAGLYFPAAGRISYVGVSGMRFDATEYRARVGFVTQDIYLFRGSLRSSLAAGRPCSDEQIWSVLEQVDASAFVRDMGGLDTESAEAGRSLSGGQRRRLGIARVLLSGSDVLIFDEVTAGLDEVNKASVLSVIEVLSARYVVLVVSHEGLTLRNQKVYSVTPADRKSEVTSAV